MLTDTVRVSLPPELDAEMDALEQIAESKGQDIEDLLRHITTSYVLSQPEHQPELQHG